jgi:hypothetical protein
MKIYNLKALACAAFMGLALSSCSDYLDHPTEDTYDTSNYYSSDAQCRAGVNYLYNSPWYDFQRGFFKVGEVLSGNFYWGGSPYLTFTLDGSDQDLANMSASLWAVNTHASTVYNNLKASSGASESVKNACMGECLTWKAMSYFYMVRSFGAVPIIHDPVTIINSQTATSVHKAKISNLYDYIVILLKKAIELLPAKDPTGTGRLDKYSAEGLLAKVYLTKAGFSESNTTYNSGTYSYITCTAHQRNADDLAEAAKYALDVIQNSGRKLVANYSDIFRGDHNVSDEALISWAWTVGAQWTSQNTLQSDLSVEGFDEFGDCWGGWNGPSVDLQDAFGENALNKTRMNVDVRRKATMMMAGDTYDYFYTDCGGFDILKFAYKGYADHVGPGKWESGTGAQEVKHLYGDNADHQKYIGTSAANMRYGLYTHLLRLSDVYLIYCEAIMGNNSSTTDSKACEYFYDVRHRGISSYKLPTSISWDDVWKERRLELACEGDRWYDFVRRYYYDPTGAINEIKAQRRNAYNGLDDLYKGYYTNGAWNVTSNQFYDTNTAAPNVTDRSFTIPLPSSDISYNPLLMDAPEDYDLSTISF